MLFQENVIMLELTKPDSITVHANNLNSDDNDYTIPPRLIRKEIVENIEIIKNILHYHTIMNLYTESSNGKYFDIVELINDRLYDSWKYGDVLFKDLKQLWNCKDGMECFYHESRGFNQGDYIELLCIIPQFLSTKDSADYASVQFKYFDDFAWGSTWGYCLEWENTIYRSFSGMDVESSGLFKDAYTEIDECYNLENEYNDDIYHIQKRIMALIIVYRLSIKIPKFEVVAFNIIIDKHKKGIDVRQYFDITGVHNKYTNQEAESIVRMWILEGI